jgi:hypothetical protein
MHPVYSLLILSNNILAAILRSYSALATQGHEEKQGPGYFTEKNKNKVSEEREEQAKTWCK